MTAMFLKRNSFFEFICGKSYVHRTYFASYWKHFMQKKNQLCIVLVIKHFFYARKSPFETIHKKPCGRYWKSVLWTRFII